MNGDAVMGAAGPRPGWRRRAAIGALLIFGLPTLLIGGLILGVHGLSRYQPLTTGSLGVGRPRYREGERFDFAYTLQNTGRWSVTITGLDLPSPSLLRTTGIFVSKPGASLNDAGDTSPRFYEPFQKFTLAPHEVRGILIHNTFANCNLFHSKDVAAVGSVAESVDFQVFGYHGHQWVPVRFAIPMPKECPGR
ncbi:MAG TPA: hypothetical protein VK646_00675 [Actinomycetota bacterium]|nr:hypothetical protein [Actinomycetota bacterium]